MNTKQITQASEPIEGPAVFGFPEQAIANGAKRVNFKWPPADSAPTAALDVRTPFVGELTFGGTDDLGRKLSIYVGLNDKIAIDYSPRPVGQP